MSGENFPENNVNADGGASADAGGVPKLQTS